MRGPLRFLVVLLGLAIAIIVGERWRRGTALDFIRNLGLFWVATVGVPTLAVLVLPFIGYVPAGDRPGEGWYGLPSGITWAAVMEHLKSTLAFAAFSVPFLPGIAVFFLLPFGAVRTAEHRIPLWAVRVLGSLLSGFLAWLIIASVGWYISIGWLAGGAGIVAAALYGARYLPTVTTDASQADTSG